MINDVYYTIRYNAVVIHRDGCEFALNENNLRQSISNVEELRAEYATEEAWLRELEIRRDALQFGLDHGWTSA